MKAVYSELFDVIRWNLFYDARMFALNHLTASHGVKR